MNSALRRWLVAVAAVVVVWLAASAITAALAGPSGTLVTVEREALRLTVTASGELQSARSALISGPSTACSWFYVLTSMAAEGSEVETGEAIAAFDTKELEQELAVQRAALAAAEKELEKAELDEQGELQKLELEGARAEADAAKSAQKIDLPEHLQSAIETERNRLEWELRRDTAALAERRLEAQRSKMDARLGEVAQRIERLSREAATTESCIAALAITAPRNGLIVYRKNWEGRKFKIGDRVFRNQPILELPDLTRMEMIARVAEPEAGAVAVGQAAELRLDARPERVFAGRIQSLGRIFHPLSEDNPSIVFDVIVAIDDPDPELMRPGMAATVELIVDRVEDVIVVPEAAVRYGADGTTVTVAGPLGGSDEREVSLGRSSGGRVVVIDGLDEGERVLVAEAVEAGK